MKKLIYSILLAGAMTVGTANAADAFVQVNSRHAARVRSENRGHRDSREHRDFKGRTNFIGDHSGLREDRGRRPSPKHVWVDGYYRWDGHRRIWNRGYWVVPPPGFTVWVPGYWGNRGGVRIWINGFWR